MGIKRAIPPVTSFAMSILASIRKFFDEHLRIRMKVGRASQPEANESPQTPVRTAAAPAKIRTASAIAAIHGFYVDR